VTEHALLLGIDPMADGEYLWIAEEALAADLPSPWIEMMDPTTGKNYYYNEQSEESCWDHPLDEDYREMFKRLKKREIHNGKIIRRYEIPETNSWQQREFEIESLHQQREMALEKEVQEWRMKLLALERSQGKNEVSRHEEKNYRRDLKELKIRFRAEESKWKDEKESIFRDLEQVTVLAEQRGSEVEKEKMSNASLTVKVKRLRNEMNLVKGKSKELEEENQLLLERLQYDSASCTQKDSESQNEEMSSVRQMNIQLQEQNDASARSMQSLHREIYFFELEKKHLEEELIASKIACMCNRVKVDSADDDENQLLRCQVFQLKKELEETKVSAVQILQSIYRGDGQNK